MIRYCCLGILTAKVKNIFSRRVGVIEVVLAVIILFLFLKPAIYADSFINLQQLPTYFSGDSDSTNSIAWGDLDADGDLDLAVGNGLITNASAEECVSSQHNKIYQNDNGILRAVPIWTAPDSDIAVTASLAWGDMDNDGDLDLAVGNCNAPNLVYINNGLDKNNQLQMQVQWSDLVSDYTSSVAWADINGDGYLDLAVGNANSPSKVYLNQKDGTLQVTPVWLSPVRTTRSVAWGDIDRDGDLDLAVGNYAAQSNVYLNTNGSLQITATWTTTLPEPTYSLAWGDVNGDGYLDLALGNAYAQSKIYLNEKGKLQTTAAWIEDPSSFQIGEPTISVTWGDINNDGNLELVVGSRIVKVYAITCAASDRCSTDSSWMSASDSSTRSVALGDVDQDGDLDLAIGATSHSPNRLFLNQGVQLRQDWRSRSEDEDQNGLKEQSTSVAWGDIDRDGDQDLVIGYESPPGYDHKGGTKLYVNEGGILRVDSRKIYSDTEDVRSIALGDVDHNGYLDLIVGSSRRPCSAGNSQQNLKLYLNDAGIFQQNGTTIGLPSCITSVALGDINGDNALDIAVGNGENNLGEQNKIYLNNGSGHFVESPEWAHPSSRTFGVAWGDVDQDGDLDLAVANENEANQLYLNVNGVVQSRPGDWFSNDTGICGNPAWGDVNDDGYPELAVRCWNGPNRLYLNNKGDLAKDAIWLSGDGTFGLDIAWGDIDGDGDLDLIATQGNNEKPVLIYLNENGTLLTTGAQPEIQDKFGVGSNALGDVDGDGDLDLALGDTFNRVLINRGHGDLRAPSNAVPYLSISRPITTGDAGFYSSPTVLYSDHITIPYSLYDIDGDAVGRVAAFYSEDGGGNWKPAIASTDTVTQNLQTFGGALNFDGVDDYVNLPTVNHDYDQGFTVEAWVDYRQFNSWSRIIDFGNGESTDNILFSNSGTSNDLSFEIYIDGIAHGIRAINALDLGGWHHLAATVDAQGNARLYKDGVVIQRGVMPLPKSVLRISNYIGRSNWVNDGYFAGKIDEVRIWKLARDQSQIVDSMNRQLQGDEAGLVAYWRFNEGAGQDIFDKTFNKMNGVLGAGVLSQQPKRDSRPASHTFVWNTFASGFFGQSDNVVFRMEAYPQLPATNLANSYRYTNTVPGPFQFVYASSTTFPFSVRGTQVQVVDEIGKAVPNAQVYRIPAGQIVEGTPIGNAANAFRTNDQGYLQGRGELKLGDQLLALQPVSLPVTLTQRYSDTVHLYYTNGTVTDAGVRALISNTHSSTVTLPGVQILQVSKAHPLLLFDVDLALEWDASKDPIYLQQLTFDLKQTSKYLYDFTNGQVALGRIRVTQDADDWNTAHVVVHATNRLRPYAVIGGVVVTNTLDFNPGLPITYSPGQVHIGSIWNRYGDPNENPGLDWPLVLAHELSHYLLFLEDTYLGLDTPSAEIGETLVNLASCTGSAMGDLYNVDNTEFVFDQPFWQTHCAKTLTALELHRNEWENITGWYNALLVPTQTVAGPPTMPFAFTTVEIANPITATNVLVNQDFFLEYAGGKTGSSEARAFLLRDDNRDGNLDYIYDLGTAAGTQNLLHARGAQPADHLCVFDRARQQYGCDAVQEDHERITLAEDKHWNPVIQVTPVNSTTFAVQVTNQVTTTSLNPLSLQARIFPEFGTEPAQVSLTPVNGVYTGTLHLTNPALDGHLLIISGTKESAIVAYSIGGNPGNTRRAGGGDSRGGGGNTRRAGGGDERGIGNTRRAGGGNLHPGDAPLISSDGKLIFFATDDLHFAAGQFYTVQDMAGLPPLPPGKTAIGQGYNLVGAGFAPNTQVLTGSISIQYAGNDVLTEQANENQLTIHFWDGNAWRALPTYRDPIFNLVSARSQGPGIYALLAGFTQPQVSNSEPRWFYDHELANLHITGSNFLAPVRVVFSVADTAVLTLPAQISDAMTIDIAIDSGRLSAREYQLTVINGDGASIRLPSTVTVLDQPEAQQCFYDKFESGANQWQSEGEWGIIALPNGNNQAMSDSPGGSYKDAGDYGDGMATSYTTTLTSRPFSLANCAHPVLTFRHDYTLARLDQGADIARVEISTVITPTWRELASFNGGGTFGNGLVASEVSSEWGDVVWKPMTITLPVDVSTGDIRLRFSLTVNNDRVTSRGWLFDDIQVQSAPTSLEPTLVPGESAPNQIYLPLVAR